MHQLKPSFTYIFCFVKGTNDNLDCTVRLASGSVEETATFVYERSKTPTVTNITPRRGGTGGGTDVTITGDGMP